MKIIELIENRTEPLISYEIIPPVRGGSVDDLLQLVSTIMKFEPPFIDVTSHSAEVHYEEMPDGTWRRKVKRKRPGTLGICAAIKGRFGVETVPHLLCEGFTREETEDALIELNYLGLQNIMALRGDKNGFTKPLPASKSRNRQALELVEQVAEMNAGHFLEELIDGVPTDFCVGVAGYPEKHYEAPNLAWDIANLKKKVEAGSDYVTTQMFFDNAHYFSFVEKCKEASINVPIVAGLKVLTSRAHLKTLPSRFNIEIPEALAAEVEEANPDHVADIGVEWAIKQSEELLNANIPCLHFYIMQTSKHVERVVSHLRKIA